MFDAAVNIFGGVVALAGGVLITNVFFSGSFRAGLERLSSSLSCPVFILFNMKIITVPEIKLSITAIINDISTGFWSSLAFGNSNGGRLLRSSISHVLNATEGHAGTV